MSFEPETKLRLRFCLLALLLLCAGSTSTVYADNTWVNVNLVITVIDQRGNPVPNAGINISRQPERTDGSKGSRLDVTGSTDANGQFTKDDVDFLLTGNPHNLTVTFDSLESQTKQLTDNQLQNLDEKGKTRITVDISLPPPKEVTLNLTCTVKSKEGGVSNFIEGANVFIASKTPGNILRGVVGLTDREGKAVLGNIKLSDAPYWLIVEKPGFNTATVPLDDNELRDAAAKNRSFNKNVELMETPGLIESTYQWVKDKVTWLINILIAIVHYGLLVLGLIFLTILSWKAILYYRQKKSGVVETQSLKPTEQPIDNKILQQIKDDVAYLKNNLMTVVELRLRLTTIDNNIKRLYLRSYEATKQRDRSQITVGTLQPTPASAPASDGEVSKSDQVTSAPGYVEAPAPALPAPVSEQKTQSFYRSLLRKLPLSIEPIYLNTEGSGSPAGKLADDSILLKEVGNTQGTFVLFADDANPTLGSVYPNPTIAFREEAVKDVFPKLTEQQFEADKESISPVAVIKIGERLWKFEPGHSNASQLY